METQASVAATVIPSFRAREDGPESQNAGNLFVARSLHFEILSRLRGFS
jgi:hypothetical protein